MFRPFWQFCPWIEQRRLTIVVVVDLFERRDLPCAEPKQEGMEQRTVFVVDVADMSGLGRVGLGQIKLVEGKQRSEGVGRGDKVGVWASEEVEVPIGFGTELPDRAAQVECLNPVGPVCSKHKFADRAPVTRPRRNAQPRQPTFTP